MQIVALSLRKEELTIIVVREGDCGIFVVVVVLLFSTTKSIHEKAGERIFRQIIVGMLKLHSDGFC